MMMAMKAMKGGAKSNPNTSAPGTKGGGKGKGKSDDRECYNCSGRGQIARNCAHPPNQQNSRVPVREAALDEGEELVWGACVAEAVQKSCTSENQPVVFKLESGETKPGTIIASGIRNSQMAEQVKSLLKSGGIKAGAIVMDPGSQLSGTVMVDELGDIDATEKGNPRISNHAKAPGDSGIKAKPWRKKIQGGYVPIAICPGLRGSQDNRTQRGGTRNETRHNQRMFIPSGQWGSNP